MSIQIDWADPAHTLLLFRFDKDWSWDDYFHAQHEITALLDASQHTVHMLIDFCAGPRILTSAVENFRSAATMKHPRRGMLFMLSPDLFWSIMGERMTHVYADHAQTVHIVESAQQAMDYISASERQPQTA